MTLKLKTQLTWKYGVRCWSSARKELTSPFNFVLIDESAAPLLKIRNAYKCKQDHLTLIYLKLAEYPTLHGICFALKITQFFVFTPFLFGHKDWFIDMTLRQYLFTGYEK